ncbi:GDP/GTP exchange factor for ARF [Coemansia sp. Benny D115]|nr:GDP/GTP exchange factor for ARF [Coemansia sp. Benny D115]
MLMATGEQGTAEGTLGFVAQSADGWRLLIEAEIDTIVRELRKNSLWAEAVERDGLGALWVGGGRWPGMHHLGANMADMRRELASRRTLGKAGECIGMASFVDRNDDTLGDDYAIGRIMILESFLLLREAINGVSNVYQLDLHIILDPYLQVIRDPETTGPITRCALVSIQRFINNGVIDLSRSEAVPALLEVTRAVTHCRFEATDAASDEAVLMQILNVLGALVLSPGGSRLNDVTICEIMETVLSMSCQMRLSEMLRKSAEATLFSLVTFVFEKLKDMRTPAEDNEDEAEENKDKEEVDEGTASIVMPSPSSMLVNTERGQKRVGESIGFGLPAIRELYRVLVALTNPTDLQYTDSMRLLALNTLQAVFQKAGDAIAGVNALRELTLGDLCRSLLLILQRDQAGLISAALRVLFLIFASHRRDTKGQLELFLCQTLGRLMTPPVLERQGSRAAMGARAAGSGPPTPNAGAESHVDGIINSKTILDIERPLTHAEEVSLYNSANLRRGVRGQVAVQETRRQLLEGLHHLLTGDEALLTDLWVNFDCNMQGGNMFDFIISLLTQKAVPWSEGDSSESDAFLDILLFYLVRIAVRAGVSAPTGRWGQLLGLTGEQEGIGLGSKMATGSLTPSQFDTICSAAPLGLPQLLDRKSHKEAMMRAALVFNEKPKDGVDHLQRIGALGQTPSETTRHLAQFLRETPTLNKRLVGEFLAKPSNLEVLQAYMALFDFAGRRLDEALRELLGAFRLPGESQQIERIMEAFATAYAASDSPDIATKDAAFILSYAVVMLNTDQHSRQVRGRMRLTDFARNLRGVNDGVDFREGFLADIFAAIRDSEIVFPGEHEGAAGFEYAWRDALEASPWMSTRGVAGSYDRALLEASWPRILQALTRILERFTTDHALRRALLGLHALVGAAAVHGLTECIDATVATLASLTGLVSPDASLAKKQQVLIKSRGRYTLLSHDDAVAMLDQMDPQKLEEESVLVSQVALDFSSSYRAQISFVAMTEIVARFASAVGQVGWNDALGAVCTAANSDMVAWDKVISGTWIPRAATLKAMDEAAEQEPIIQRQEGGGGLLSAFSSLWGSSPGTESPRSGVRRQEQPFWRAAPDSLAAAILRARKAIDASAVSSLVDLPRDQGSSEETLSVFLGSLAHHIRGTLSETAKSTEYTPSAVFCFVLATSLLVGSPERAPAMWSVIETAIHGLLECADGLHSFVLKQLVQGLLSVASRVLEVSTGQNTALLDVVERIVRCLGLLRDASDGTFDVAAPALATGICQLVALDARALATLPTSWDILRQLFKRLAQSQATNATADSMSALPQFVALLSSGAIDRSTHFVDVLDLLSAYMPSDRMLLSSAAEARSQASVLVSLIFDMQAAAKADAGNGLQSSTTSPNIGGGGHQRTLTEPSIASATSRIGAAPRSSPMSMWVAAMNALSSYAYCGSREVRQLACAHIQRAIGVDLRPVSWIKLAFHRVLFPLMDALLRADMLADGSMEDTHARCISLLTSSFLRNVAALQSAESSENTLEGSDPPLNHIWLRLIGVLSAYIYTSNLAKEARTSPPGSPPAQAAQNNANDKHGGHLGVLGEMAEESTRNCILVLETMGIFGAADEDRNANALWKKTWEVLDKASPQLRRSIFPEPDLAVDAKAAAGDAPTDPEGAQPAEHGALAANVDGGGDTSANADANANAATHTDVGASADAHIVANSSVDVGAGAADSAAAVAAATATDNPVDVVSEAITATLPTGLAGAEGQLQPPVTSAEANNGPSGGLLSSPAEANNASHNADHHSETKKKKKTRVNIITVS